MPAVMMASLFNNHLQEYNKLLLLAAAQLAGPSSAKQSEQAQRLLQQLRPCFAGQLQDSIKRLLPAFTLLAGLTSADLNKPLRGGTAPAAMSATLLCWEPAATATRRMLFFPAQLGALASAGQ